MFVKAKHYSKKIIELARAYYLFLACLVFILAGVDLMGSHYWDYKASEGEIIGGNIQAGLKIVAGSILVGASLLSLTIARTRDSK